MTGGEISARARAEHLWRKRKGPMAAYWRAARAIARRQAREMSRGGMT